MMQRTDLEEPSRYVETCGVVSPILEVTETRPFRDTVINYKEIAVLFFWHSGSIP